LHILPIHAFPINESQILQDNYDVQYDPSWQLLQITNQLLLNELTNLFAFNFLLFPLCHCQQQQQTTTAQQQQRTTAAQQPIRFISWSIGTVTETAAEQQPLKFITLMGTVTKTTTEQQPVKFIISLIGAVKQGCQTWLLITNNQDCN
jgi:hypothetical protein